MPDTVADYSYTRSECLMSIENLGVHYDRPILRDINLKIYDIVRPNLTQGQVVSV